MLVVRSSRDLVRAPVAPLLAISMGLFASCGGDDGGGTGEPDAAAPQTVTIQEIQDDALADGTPVRVEGVVVTAIDQFGDRQGAIYVQEPEGGARSGVVVNTGSVPSGVEVGSIVTVTGIKDEFSLDTDPLTVTQINSPNVKVTGSGTVPPAEVVDPRDLADPAVAEDWEGVLIEVQNVRFEGLPGAAIGMDDTFREARITGPFLVQSALAPFPEMLGYRDCYASIVGIGDYFFDYKVQPRSATDYTVATDDGACPAQETTCDNDADDDADGFTDCQDFACYAADKDAATNTCAAEATVIEVQEPESTVAVDDTVEVTGRITAIGRDRDELWLQTAASTGADHDGLHVELFRSPLPEDGISTDFALGDVVTVVGIRRDSFGETVLAQADLVKDADGEPGDVVLRTGVSSDPISDPAMIEQASVYEGQVLSFGKQPLSDVSQLAMYGTIVTSTGMVIEDTLYSYKDDLADLTTDDCLDITGVVLLNTFDDFYFLAPRQVGDIAKTVCVE